MVVKWALISKTIWQFGRFLAGLVHEVEHVEVGDTPSRSGTWLEEGVPRVLSLLTADHGIGS